MSVGIDLTPLGVVRVRIAPRKKLGRGTFDDYLRACREGGAWYDRDQRAQVTTPERVPRLMKALQAIGLRPFPDPALEAHLAGGGVPLVGDRLANLYPFQREGARFLSERPRALLADEMGLGKTIQELASIPERAPVLVVAPAAVKGVWKNEAATWRPEIVTRILSGRSSFEWPLNGVMHITNYDVLPAELASEPLPGTRLIADEAHALKSGKAARTKRFRELSKAVLRKGGSVHLLTGTPLMNRPPELWAVLRAARLEEEAFGSWPHFKKLFGAVAEIHGRKNGKLLTHEVWGQPSAEVAACLQRVSLRRHRREVLPDLPVKIHRDIVIDSVPAATQQLCDELLARLRRAGIDLSDASKAVDLTKLEAAGFELLAQVRKALAIAKAPAAVAMAEQFEENEEPLVVFSAHRPPVDLLSTRPGWAAITGDVSPHERTEIVRRFQAGELRGIALTIRAGGTGLTLTRAHQVLFVDLEWTPAANAQAEDRVCRIGQDRGVIVTRLISPHIVDRRVTELLAEKQELIGATVDASATKGDPWLTTSTSPA